MKSKREELYASSNWYFTGYLFGWPTGRPFTWWAWYPVKTQSRQWKWFSYVGCIQIQKKTWLDGPDWKFYAYSDTRIET